MTQTIDDGVEEVIIDKSLIGNPKLRVVVQERTKSFIFSYSDNKRHTDYEEYDEYTEYQEEDYCDTSVYRDDGPRKPYQQ